jgi:hypothetical protein
MDCKTARLLLDYGRPRADELAPAEAAALETHLTGCGDCGDAARSERGVDAALGRAMRKVEAPDGLRAAILARLADDQSDRRRRWFRHGLRWAAAAAALVLLAWGVWSWRVANRPAFPAEPLLSERDAWKVAPTNAAEVQASFKRQGVETRAPAGLKYRYLAWTVLAFQEGRPTPLLYFTNQDDTDARSKRHAWVYIVSDDEFKLDALPRGDVGGESSYRYRCAVLPEKLTGANGTRFGYVVYYTGDNLGWLEDVPGAGAGDAAAGN